MRGVLFFGLRPGCLAEARDPGIVGDVAPLCPAHWLAVRGQSWRTAYRQPGRCCRLNPLWPAESVLPEPVRSVCVCLCGYRLAPAGSCSVACWGYGAAGRLGGRVHQSGLAGYTAGSAMALNASARLSCVSPALRAHAGRASLDTPHKPQAAGLCPRR